MKQRLATALGLGLALFAPALLSGCASEDAPKPAESKPPTSTPPPAPTDKPADAPK